MTIPLIVLAVLSVVGGLIGIPEVLHGHHYLEAYLKPVFEDSSLRLVHHLSHGTEIIIMIVAVLVMVLALLFAYIKYVKNKTLPANEGETLNPIHNLVYKKYLIDELYENVIMKPINFIGEALHKVVDNQIVDGIVNGFGSMVTGVSGVIRKAQSGNIGFYVFVMVISIVLILFTQLF
jgi:NADH-quinone oxidoreductase subunit L